MSDRVQSVERCIDILMTLADGPKTLTAVTRETGLSKATAFRLLASLNYENLVVKAADQNVYTLGPGALRLLQGVTRGVGAISAIAKPALVELWEKTGETVTIHVRVGLERVCIEELPSPAPLRYVSTVGASAPLHIGSAGKALLAAMDPDETARTVAALPLSALTSETITDPQALREELDTVRARGWATSSGERISGAAAVSVPVRGTHGFLASLSVLGPAERMPEETKRAYAELLQDAAAKVEQALANGGARGGVVEAAS